LVRGDLGTLEELVKAFHRERVEVSRRRLSFLEEFHAGFAHLVHEYVWSRNGLLVVLVDDVDRCAPARALNVLETIKLYLDVPGCVFLIAADRDAIERAAQGQYGAPETDGRDGSPQGRSYLEKLVQLPFHLPPLEDEQIVSFISNHAPQLDAACREVFALGLEPNPRMVKRALNIFQLLSSLAQRRAETGAMEPVVPGLLAKMVVIQTRYHSLYRDLQEYPNLIQDLEIAAREGTEVRQPVLPLPADEVASEAATLLEQYLRHKPLLRMLRAGPAFAGLTRERIGAYIYLTRTTDAEGDDRAADVSRRRWADLLANDPTRLRAAVAAIRDEGTAQWYVDALVRLLDPTISATASERLSAAAALGYLGDPRDFDEMIDIPGGQFLRGAGKEATMVMAFRLGRYPVTNAQYARFLAANPSYPAPFLNEDWALPYNWDPQKRTCPEGKANHPVVLVSWDDAKAYCVWAGVRLPTEVEWEKGARGDDDRAYPWGDPFDPSYANTRESGFGCTTPVGAYPGGASPHGLLDCAGNVWEWTATPHDEDEAILRGGSWNFHHSDACTFSRERAHRAYRSNRIGFRVAAGPLPGS
jgi:formylglycine-generating enzyme required for sulfatase activity